MRWRPLTWLLLSVLCFVGAAYFWRLGEERRLKKSLAAPAPPATHAKRAPRTLGHPAGSPLQSPPITLLSVAALSNAVQVPTAPQPADKRFPYRLSNSPKRLNELQRTDTAVLLENAFIDTTRPRPSIPEHLRAQGDPGSYIVQSRGPLDGAFRAALKGAGAEIVSYIPNNAYLVQMSLGGAQQIAAEAQSVMPYEPYYKLKPGLLKLAMEQRPLPENTALNVLLFPGTREATLGQLEKLGARVLGEERSPFGPVLRVRPSPDSLPALARLAGVQEMEVARQRVSANDLSRVRVGVAVNTTNANNYLGLTGNNVLVNVNDSGVDATHVDLTPRVFGDSASSLVDSNGHGTHVAGIIASSGAHSDTVTNASGSVTNADFRGKAPASKIFSMTLGLSGIRFGDDPFGLFRTDTYLQETAARTNAFISNNSWHYLPDPDDLSSYDLAAASYDAAVRDALPEVIGSQPLLYVFSAGNDGGGGENGAGGNADTISSPGSAKNVITVGAIEQPRGITNEVWKDCVLTNLSGSNVLICAETNTPWRLSTDTNNQVAGFSGRGNVGMGIEGEFGRFKPDVVAPGTFVVSTRSGQWDERAYYNPTSYTSEPFPNFVLATNQFFANPFAVQDNCVQVTLRITPNEQSSFPFPDLPIFIKQSDAPTLAPPSYDFVRTNIVSMPPDGGGNLAPRGVNWWYGLLNTWTQTVAFDLIIERTLTNELGNYFEVLSNLNNQLGPYYRYESGTSMSAADVAGTLALMQEFFEQRLGRTNSPALMKALLINGARSLGDAYDFEVNNTLNSQGWGLVRLPNSLRGDLTNVNAMTVSAQIFDQSPTNALATGQSRTYRISIPRAAQNRRLRATLVWTDPPGNPVAGTKLVNDLDLIVTNLDNGDVFFGNDILGNSDSNSPWDTNTVPNVDVVNNVENVYLAPSPALATNYAITVLARRVNVNAVTAHTNDVVQDYALAISIGDEGQVGSAFTLTNVSQASANLPFVTILTNQTAVPGLSGGSLSKQRVGANSPLLGNNTIQLGNNKDWGTNGVITLGVTNQWHFYVATNDQGFTNAAFAVSRPPNLSIPRMGVREFAMDNATRVQADIDLYVSRDSGLTNLAPAAIAAADKSLGRGGSEAIIYSNASAGLYYVGVKSEDQEAAEYRFTALFSESPFSQCLSNGVLMENPFPYFIPDGTAENPSAVIVDLFNACEANMKVRRVIATNQVWHELFGDLEGTLTHETGDGAFAVLNNHSPDGPLTNGPAPFWGARYIYDDSDEGDVPFARHTAGPGTLRTFRGKEAGVQWGLTMVDNQGSHIGTNEHVWVFLEKQEDLTQGVTSTLLPGRCRDFFIDVPVEATNLTIFVSILSGTGPVSLEICPEGASGSDCVLTNISAPGGQLSVSKLNIPPLNRGTYVVRLCNLGPDTVTVYILATLELDLAGIAPTIYSILGDDPIRDDAVSYSTIDVPDSAKIASIEVGLRVDHPRVSDMVFHLISPSGKRILLFENRTGTNTAGLGGGVLITNVSKAAAGDATANTNILNVGQNSGVLIIDYQFFQVPDFMHIYYDGNLIRDTGLINGSGHFSVSFGPGVSTNIVILMNEGGNSNTNTQWNYTATVVSGTFNYFTFTENTNLTRIPVKFAAPPFAGQGGSTNIPISGFEGVPAGDYVAPAVVDGWSVRTSNRVSVVGPPLPAQTGVQSLALLMGQIERTLPTTSGRPYRLDFAYRKAPNLDPVSWWPADLNANDIVDGNHGLLVGGVTYGPATVNQGFVFNGRSGSGVRVGNAANLRLQDFTIEAWIKRTNPTIASFDFNGGIIFGYGPGGYNFAMFDDGTPFLGRVTVDYVAPNVRITDTNLHHVAVTKFGTTVVLYVDGVAYPTPPYSSIFTFTTPAAVGARGDNLVNSFYGTVDEVSIFNRALNGAEIRDIYSAGASGKCGMVTPPTLCPLFGTQVSIPGVTNALAATTTNWATYSLPFAAPSSGTPLNLASIGGQAGMLLDSFTLKEIDPAGVFYFPEESLKDLIGDNAQGEWKLEMWDNRVGPAGATSTLVSWQLKFIYENATPALIGLTHANPVATSVPAGGVRHFYVDVPSWASFATNILVNANGPVSVYFNQYLLPGTNGSDVLLFGPAATGSRTLQTNGTPALLPGQRYFLGVKNSGAAQVDFTFEVDFDITPLTNAIPLTNSLPALGGPRYYQFDVSTNAIAAVFELLNPSGDVDLIARKGVPLPTLTSFDYGSFNFGANDEVIVVTTNSSPVALTAGRWYLGVLNRDTVPVTYAIRATEIISPLIICLTNGVPFNYAAPPGAALRNFFCFQINQTNSAALYELYYLSGDADLTLKRNSLPFAPPYFAGSFSAGTNYEQIVIRTNVALPDINATWYLGVPNNDPTNVTYTIRAVVSTNGLLISALPLTLMVSLIGTNGPLLMWNAVDGEHYDVQISTNLINWSLYTNLTAFGRKVTWIDPTPTAGIPMRFYRIVQVP